MNVTGTVRCSGSTFRGRRTSHRNSSSERDFAPTTRGVNGMRILPKLGLATAAITLVALGTTVPADAITVSQVKAAQTRLNSLGCTAGPVDGNAGAMTQAATVRF